jgi:hypothetical protein
VQPAQPKLPSAIERYRQRATDLYSQGADLMDQEPDMAPIQAYAKQRGQQGNAAMLNALAAQYAGDSFEPIQAQYLKRAAAARDPMKMGSGYITPEGQYIKDPEVAQNKKAEFLMNQAKAYETLAQTAQTAQERAEATRLQNEATNALREMMATNQAQFRQQQLELQRQGLAIRQANAGSGQVGAFSPNGYTPDGRQIVTNSKSGMNYLLDVKPDGTPSYTPYTGQAIPKASYEKQIVEGSDLSGSAFNADQLIKKVETNPQAFGLRGAAIATLPGSLQGYGAKAVALTPAQMEVRANVLRDAAMEVNRLYGAALSMGEQARASSFLPDAKDPPEMVITKLKAARDWAQSKLGNLPAGVQKSVGARAGATAQGGIPSPDAIAAELARRGVK